MNGLAGNHTARHGSLRLRALFLGIIGASVLVAAPAVAHAASRASATIRGRQVISRTAGTLSSSICSKVSAASVSAIVGYSVPAATPSTSRVAATKANDEVSAVMTTCTFGADATVAELLKDVTLQISLDSRVVTIAETEQAYAKLSTASFKIKVRPYSGLGVPGLYLTLSEGGVTGEGIAGIAGTTTFDASVEGSLPLSKLASLAKLARNL